VVPAYPQHFLQFRTFSHGSIFNVSDNFPCRDPKTLALIPSGTTYFNPAECSQCSCYMGKLSCEKNIKKCYPNACHLQDGETVQNLAIHNDGCNNCLCYFGKTRSTYIRNADASVKMQIRLTRDRWCKQGFHPLCLYSKSSLTLKGWSFNLSFPSMLFLNSWRVSSHIVMYDTNSPAIQKQH
jgi:hypothetical protein